MSEPATITITRGAWKLLEETLRFYAEGRTTSQFVKLCTLWDLLRKANTFTYQVEGEEVKDNEYQDWLNEHFPEAQGASKDVQARLKHNGAFNRLWGKWLENEQEVKLTPKQFDLAREFIKKRVKEGKVTEGAERGKTILPLPVSEHSLKLLLAFQLDEDPVD